MVEERVEKGQTVKEKDKSQAEMDGLGQAPNPTAASYGADSKPPPSRTQLDWSTSVSWASLLFSRKEEQGWRLPALSRTREPWLQSTRKIFILYHSLPSVETPDMRRCEVAPQLCPFI